MAPSRSVLVAAACKYQRSAVGGAEQHALMSFVGEDTDKPKTIQDQMQLRSKIRLMKQFQWGVAAYVIAKAAVILLPAFVWAEPGDAAIKTIYILQNCVRWLFLAVLCWIFR